MKVAILGTRGVPARYGGFETLAERLALALADRGHDVTVYCRRLFTTPQDNFDPRIRRVILPAPKSKYLETVVHTFLSVAHVIFTDVDVVLMCNVANSPLAWIPRMLGKPVVLNVDGLDRKRRKWNWFARAVLQVCEALSVVTPSRLVTDARAIQHYYRRRYRRSSHMIAYGSDPPFGPHDLDGFNLPAKRYLLYVSRFEPENNPELVLKAFQQSRSEWPLVMVGDNVYDPSKMRHLRSLANGRVVFTGYVYGERYWRLQRNAGAYVFASEVGGTHPALIEAMAVGNPVLYLDTPENREAAGGCGIPFRPSTTELSAAIEKVVSDHGLRNDLGQRAQARARAEYSWQRVANQYEELFRELVS